MKMTWVEKLLYAAILLILVPAFIGLIRNSDEFKKVCDSENGTTVWDGRQHQCIKERTS